MAAKTEEWKAQQRDEIKRIQRELRAADAVDFTKIGAESIATAKKSDDQVVRDRACIACKMALAAYQQRALLGELSGEDLDEVLILSGSLVRRPPWVSMLVSALEQKKRKAAEAAGK